MLVPITDDECFACFSSVLTLRHESSSIASSDTPFCIDFLYVEVSVLYNLLVDEH